ncbi:MAG: hypothetical protein Q7S82_01680 [bacterium]|nr:hypothetical protein [bacterium]
MRENSIPYKVLIKLSELVDLGVTFLIWDFDEIRKITGISSFSGYKITKPIFYKGLNSLKRNGFIGIKNDKEIQLSSKGRTEIIKYKIKSKIEKQKWDGQWRAICWDVPEISRNDRNFLRRQIKWLGFKELQKSFWVFPYEFKEEIQELIELVKRDLAGDIRFLLINKIENDDDLREYFFKST